MPRQTEPSANNALGALLQAMLGSSRVRTENTRVIADHPRLRPDIVITRDGRSPVVIEAEYMPAPTAEEEAKSRLNLELARERRMIEAAIALRYPEDVADADDLAAAISAARLSYCVFTNGRRRPTRFPESGWLEGSVSDLADLARLVSLPQNAVDAAANAMEQGIDRVAAILDEIEGSRAHVNRGIARLLGMTNVPQMRRMACAIIANAMVFHDRMAGMYKDVRPLRLVCGREVADPQAEILEAWSRILRINYWPIFAVGRDILNQLPSDVAARLLRTLETTSGEVRATGIDNSHDLTGRVFQRLIADRKYLATFYTLPSSASLLARLAVAKMDVDWSDAEAIGKLRVGDFACGTGALLSAVYEQIAARHERAGGDPAVLHPSMMEEVLYGCDVMPSAVHITSSTLSGAQPEVIYRDSRTYTLAYGRLPDTSVRIGSLELLESSSAMTLFNTSDPGRRTGSIGEETASHLIVEIADAGFDLVIMNPPFTRATNHEGAHADITNPAFAAFDATPDDQTAMGRRVNQLGRPTCYHGNAGIASAFAALADKKLKPGGVLALVLPLSAAAGLSWQDFRKMLAEGYADLTVVSIAANGRDMSFSSDTGMAECLVVARKLLDGASAAQDETPRFVSLSRRPQGLYQAAEVAKELLRDVQEWNITDGPFGGSPIEIGEEEAGQTVRAARVSDGESWRAVRTADYSLAQTAQRLTESELWLPGAPTLLQLKQAPINSLGRMGYVHRDITGPLPRGPFNKAAASPTATYPALWNHNARRETRMVCEPDSQLRVRPGQTTKAGQIWATASRAHLNLDFTFGAQPLAVAFTDTKTIGGRVWPNVSFADNRCDHAFAVWGNSTLGLLSFWWHSSRQQSSKASVTIRSAESLPVLDFRALSNEQLDTAEAIFEEFRDLELKPAYLADADPNRALLDRRVVCDLLGFDEATYEGVRRLAAKWCAEPSVHGGKARPRGAALVV